jgi:hypothetical protein
MMSLFVNVDYMQVLGSVCAEPVAAMLERHQLSCHGNEQSIARLL